MGRSTDTIGDVYEYCARTGNWDRWEKLKSNIAWVPQAILHSDLLEPDQIDVFPFTHGLDYDDHVPDDFFIGVELE